MSGEHSPRGRSAVEGVLKGSNIVLMMKCWLYEAGRLSLEAFAYFFTSYAEGVIFASLRCLQMDPGLT